MTFNEYIAAGYHDTFDNVECPICGYDADCGHGSVIHLEIAHGFNSHHCECGCDDLFLSYEKNFDHYASFPDPAEHVRHVAVLAALRDQSQ